jgi:DNA sulfur modification protein DndC
MAGGRVRRAQATLFDGARLTLDDSIELTLRSLREYGPRFDRWAIAWSGGKDSTAVVTLVVHLIESGQIPRPKRLTVLYADTRMELLPLAVSAQVIAGDLRDRGIDVRTVMAPLDRRFLVYILGRGVPPPNNTTFRWCTRQIKVDPMHAELARLAGEDVGKVLMLTGVRQGESAIRDQKIAMSCGRNGAECGQGWYQQDLPGALCDTLAPLLHWRVCHVWDWLRFFAPAATYGAWQTALLAEAYGGEEAEEVNARTGCMGCPLTDRDTALDVLLQTPAWSYLRPLKDLRPIYRALREPRNRLRKPGGEARADGSLVDNQHRMGPITLEARLWALGEILAIEDRVNAVAIAENRPRLDILNDEEISRIRALITAKTWPQRWDGDEPRADEPFEEAGATMRLFGGSQGALP